ncbi:MAG: hypothetical protein JO154_20670 [Chitinophaga sp.]|uniref:hypothetical protein n=1 Tax=Chitinophaga sp. TaxID=1869181 RepID=UPI0025B897DB|nr:hypothetical protein [Chitinophaga sp.]MBV8255027.1 hypothetical protein [Chitinophaga sp.]
MKKTSSWLSLSALIFCVFVVSCSKRDNPAPATVFTGPVALLDSVVETSTNNEKTQHYFTYNADSGVAKFTILYSDKHFMSDFLFYDNSPVKRLLLVSQSLTGKVEDVYGTRRCYYNTAGLLTTVKNNSSDSTSLVYNSNKQLIGRYSYNNDSIYESNVLTWSGPNLVKSVYTYYRSGDPKLPVVFTYNYKYDNKRNAYSSVGFYSMLGYASAFYWLSANNVVEMEQSSGGNTFIYTFNYEYNNKNYPVTGAVNVSKKLPGENFNFYNATKRFVYKD